MSATVVPMAVVRPESIARGGRWRRVTVVAREEFRRALESRGLFGFTALLTALVLALSFFGLVQSREVGFQGFARVTLSLMNLVLVVVPLTGLMLGVASVTGNSASLSLILAQPVSRGEVLIGKWLGLAASLTAAQAVGFGAGGLVITLQAGPEQSSAFVALACLSIVLGWLSLSAAFLISVLCHERLQAISAALLLWLLMVVAYDLAVLGATTLLSGLPLQSVLVPALLLNPVDLTRVLTTLGVGSGALFGPTSAVLAQTFGSAGGIALGLVTLLLETVAPLWLALVVFRRRDG